MGMAEGRASGKASAIEKTNDKCGRAGRAGKPMASKKKTINAGRVDGRKAGGVRQSEFNCGRVGSGRATCGVGSRRSACYPINIVLLYAYSLFLDRY